MQRINYQTIVREKQRPRRGAMPISSLHSESSSNQHGVSYILFFPRLIISRQIKQRSGYKQPPRKVHEGLLPSLSLCRSWSKDSYMGRWVAMFPRKELCL